jgi:hypothetical protein
LVLVTECKDVANDFVVTVLHDPGSAVATFTEAAGDVPGAGEGFAVVDANGGHDAADHAALEACCAAETMHRHTTEGGCGSHTVGVLVFFGREIAAVNWLFELGGYGALFGCHVAHAEAAASLANVVWLEAILFEFEERPVDFVEDTVALPAANA